MAAHPWSATSPSRLTSADRVGRGKVFNDQDAIRANHDAAVQRAKRSLREREIEGQSGGNPSTSMHLLMESIRGQGHG